MFNYLYFKWMQFTTAPAQNKGLQSTVQPSHVPSATGAAPNPIISQPRKRAGFSHKKCPPLCWKKSWRTNEKEQVFTTQAPLQYRIKVMWTDGFRMLPYTLPRVTRGRPFSQMSEIYILCLESFHSKNEKVHLTWNWKCVYTVSKI